MPRSSSFHCAILIGGESFEPLERIATWTGTGLGLVVEMLPEWLQTVNEWDFFLEVWLRTPRRDGWLRFRPLIPERESDLYEVDGALSALSRQVDTALAYTDDYDNGVLMREASAEQLDILRQSRQGVPSANTRRLVNNLT